MGKAAPDSKSEAFAVTAFQIEHFGLCEEHAETKWRRDDVREIRAKCSNLSVL